MQCSIYVPDGFEFKTVGGSAFHHGFTLKVSSMYVMCVSWVDIGGSCIVGVQNLRSSCCGLFFVSEGTLGQVYS
jgi:hypothetical protein